VRRKIITKIGDLIEWHCKACEHNQSNMNLSQIQYCRQHCEIGQELARLGRILEGKERGEIEMAKITKEAYEAMKKEGKSDKFIADYFGVTQATLSYHKKKWESKEATETEEQHETGEAKQVIKEIKKRLTEQEETIAKLREENARLKEELQASKETLVETCNEADREYEKWQKELKTYKDALDKALEENDRLEQENNQLAVKVEKLKQLLQVAIEL
jgi:chromosome segregation ATPase